MILCIFLVLLFPNNLTLYSRKNFFYSYIKMLSFVAELSKERCFSLSFLRLLPHEKALARSASSVSWLELIFLETLLSILSESLQNHRENTNLLAMPSLARKYWYISARKKILPETKNSTLFLVFLLQNKKPPTS
jgi:hypothetical protein